ncbi:MAG: glutathione S-transferase family protein [Candidatus Binatia bacterium]
MLTIHHLVYSRSDRIVWLAEELGLDYKMATHHRDPQTFRSPPSLWEVSPMGKAPVIQDGTTTVSESGAVVEYMLDHYGQGKLRPKAGTSEYIQYLHWMHAAESTLMTPVLMDVLSKMMQMDSPLWKGFFQGEYKTVFDRISSDVGTQGYIAGPEFTAADIMVSYPLRMADSTAIPVPGFQSEAPCAEYPNLVNYLNRLRARPAYQRAEKKCIP